GSVLEKYDGRRPLIPWLIRVFHNSNLTKLRQSKHDKPLGDDEADEMYWHAPEISDEHWHQEFRLAAQEWLETLSDQEKLLLGLRVRYRLTQREAASFLGIHESNVSRLTDKIRQNFVQMIEPKLLNAGWSGEDMIAFVNTEMETLILDDPRLSSESLAVLLAKKGLQAPLQNI
ncbi:MAG: sigma-70 family RNA polymerase sigma factor, partial [Planctomycetota bacterium]